MARVTNWSSYNVRCSYSAKQLVGDVGTREKMYCVAAGRRDERRCGREVGKQKETGQILLTAHTAVWSSVKHWAP